MEFAVDLSKKRAICATVIRTTPSIHRLQTLSWISLMFAPILAIVHYFLGWKIPELYLIRTVPAAEKDAVVIAGVSLMLFCWCVLSGIVLRAFVIRKIKWDLRERDCEQMKISEGAICYLFRMKYAASAHERVQIRIPLNDSCQVVWDKQKEKMVFSGSILCSNLEDIHQPELAGNSYMMLEEFVLYDYFKPNLYPQLKSLRISTRECDEAI